MYSTSVAGAAALPRTSPLCAPDRWARGVLPLAPGLLAARHRSGTVAADGAGNDANSRKAKHSAKPVSASVGIVTYPNSLIHLVAQPPGAERRHAFACST